VSLSRPAVFRLLALAVCVGPAVAYARGRPRKISSFRPTWKCINRGVVIRNSSGSRVRYQRAARVDDGAVKSCRHATGIRRRRRAGRDRRVRFARQRPSVPRPASRRTCGSCAGFPRCRFVMICWEIDDTSRRRCSSATTRASDCDRVRVTPSLAPSSGVKPERCRGVGGHTTPRSPYRSSCPLRSSRRTAWPDAGSAVAPAAEGRSSRSRTAIFRADCHPGARQASDLRRLRRSMAKLVSVSSLPLSSDRPRRSRSSRFQADGLDAGARVRLN